jgi:hypothetical protein
MRWNDISRTRDRASLVNRFWSARQSSSSGGVAVPERGLPAFINARPLSKQADEGSQSQCGTDSLNLTQIYSTFPRGGIENSRSGLMHPGAPAFYEQQNMQASAMTNELITSVMRIATANGPRCSSRRFHDSRNLRRCHRGDCHLLHHCPMFGQGPHRPFW